MKFDRLATYNAERARGIVHTEEWQAEMAAEMAAEQERFDQRQTDVRIWRAGLGYEVSVVTRRHAGAGYFTRSGRAWTRRGAERVAATLWREEQSTARLA